jgi:hypothetical protein
LQPQGLTSGHACGIQDIDIYLPTPPLALNCNNFF